MSSGELFFNSPPSLRITWNIPNFYKLVTESKGTLQSPDFTFANERYCLRLLSFDRFHSLRIELQNFIDSDTAGDIWYEILLKSTAEEIDISLHLNDNKKVVYFSFSKLESERDLHVPGGTLTVLCFVRLRKPSSAGSPKSGAAQTQVFPKYTMSGELSFESLPLLYVVWRIPGFFQIARKFIYALESPKFPFFDRHYYLRLFSSEGGAAIELVNSAGTVSRTYVSYEIGLKAKTGEEFFVTRCRKGKVYIYRSEFDRVKDEYFSDGHLIVFCSMLSREPSSAGSPKSGGAETKVFPGVKVPVLQAATHLKSSGTEFEVFPGLKSPVPQAATHQKSVGVPNSNEEEDKEALPDISKLSSDLKKLLQKVPDSDACLVVSGKEFRAHQIILRARSTVFDAMFGHETAERESGRVVIDDLDPDSFGHFLEYLYTGVVGAGLSDDNAFELYKAADRYDVPTLKAECVAHMRRSLSVDSFCEVLTVALRHKEEKLLSRAVTFFKQNIARIIGTAKWKQFVVDDGESDNELFMKAVVLPEQ